MLADRKNGFVDSPLSDGITLTLVSPISGQSAPGDFRSSAISSQPKDANLVAGTEQPYESRVTLPLRAGERQVNR